MTPEERFSRALHSTARQWRVALDARLKDLGVSQAGWMTIALVAKAETAPSQGELATQLSVEPATMVAMIDRLVKGGLVERVASTSDRRIKHIHLTDAGKTISDEVHSAAEAFRMEVLKGISSAKMDQFSELLEHIQARIGTVS